MHGALGIHQHEPELANIIAATMTHCRFETIQKRRGLIASSIASRT